MILREDSLTPDGPMDATDARTHAAPPLGPACPQCGGPVEVGGAPLTTCGHCRATLWLDLDRFVRHAVLAPRVGPGEARGALARFLRAAEVDCDAKGPAPRLELHPWWAISAPGGVRVVRASAETAFSLPPKRAAEAGESETGDTSVLRDTEPGEPTVPLDDAVAEVEGGRPEGARLVHVPSWRIDYEDGGTRYVAHVDAVEGEVSALTLPPASTRRLDSVATAWITAAIVLFAIEAAVLPGIVGPLVAFGVTGAAFFAFVRAGERGPR